MFFFLSIVSIRSPNNKPVEKKNSRAHITERKKKLHGGPWQPFAKVQEKTRHQYKNTNVNSVPTRALRTLAGIRALLLLNSAKATTARLKRNEMDKKTDKKTDRETDRHVIRNRS